MNAPVKPKPKRVVKYRKPFAPGFWTRRHGSRTVKVKAA